MKLIVGLGNPGSEYVGSRHNAGFVFLKALAREKKAVFRKDSRTSSLVAKIKCAGSDIVLALPLTYMNLSGIAVKKLLDKYEIGLEDLLVVCDDLNLDFGRIRLRISGSSGGHRGLESIIEHLGSCNFARLRIGIGRPKENLPASEYVLDRFSLKEKKCLKDIITEAIKCCYEWICKRATRTINIFNLTDKKGRKNNG
ncbi:MAG: aminoacyl-tRNA hydrolase [Candidatus Omnitrophica bacterium]|nr:aminoacyl-tRNA hydrolase [Candidatus Omnitrophota bacterium]